LTKDEKMKTAVVYDFLITKGGMDRAAAILAREFKADIWTTSYAPEDTYPELEKFKIFQHPLTFLHRQGLMQTEALFKFRRMDLSDYDLILSSGDWGKHVGMRSENHPQLHFENTVVRPFYDLYPFIKSRLPMHRRQLFKLWVWWMRGLDKQAVQKIDKIICNSEVTKGRIKKYYGMDAEVVWVPVDVKRFKHRRSENFYFSVQRIAPPKRVELQIEAFRRLPSEKLVIAGPYDDRSYFEELRKTAPENVEFVGTISDGEIVDLYSRCKAAIQTSIDEDFGQVPLEAMASGKPCIAVNEGGFRISITHGKTGLLVDPPYFENLIKAIKNFDRYEFDPAACRKRAKMFAEEKWVERIKAAAREILR